MDVRLQAMNSVLEASVTGLSDRAHHEQIVELKNSCYAIQADFKATLIVHENSTERLLNL